MKQLDDSGFQSLIDCLPCDYKKKIQHYYDKSFSLTNSPEEIYNYCLDGFIDYTGISAGYRTIFWDIPTLLNDYYNYSSRIKKHPFESREKYKGYEKVDIAFTTEGESACIFFDMIYDDVIDDKFKSDFIFILKKYYQSVEIQCRYDYYESYRIEIKNYQFRPINKNQNNEK